MHRVAIGIQLQGRPAKYVPDLPAQDHKPGNRADHVAEPAPARKIGNKEDYREDDRNHNQSREGRDREAVLRIVEGIDRVDSPSG